MKNHAFRITLCFSIVFRITQAVYAQDADGPRVIVKTAPEAPAALSSWTLTLFIDHPLPEEVTVMAPPFTDTFLLERFLKNFATVEQSPWTQAEYRFILNNSGTFTLDSFTVITPLGKTATPPITVNVQRARGRQDILRPKLVWEGEGRLAAGESAVFSLKASGWDSSQPLPDFKLFAPPVPKGLILESLEPLPEEKAAGLALKLRIIPLEAGAAHIPARTVSYGGAVFEIPALRITAGAPVQVPLDSAAGTAGNALSDVSGSKKNAPFPAPESYGDFRLSAKYRQDCEGIYQTARNLWERGYRAEALAELRRNERDHPAGRFFAEIRREAERSLGLLHTLDENRGPAVPWAVMTAVFFVLALAAIRLRLVRSWLRKKTFAAAALLIAAALVCLCMAVKPRLNIFGFDVTEAAKHPRFGVTRETEVRRIPGNAGAVIFSFGEGQPVRLFEQISKTAGENAGSWYRVVAHNEAGESGWISEDKIVFY
jgi:hypothetical protein